MNDKPPVINEAKSRFTHKQKSHQVKNKKKLENVRIRDKRWETKNLTRIWIESRNETRIVLFTVRVKSSQKVGLSFEIFRHQILTVY